MTTHSVDQKAGHQGTQLGRVGRDARIYNFFNRYQIKPFPLFMILGLVLVLAVTTTSALAFFTHQPAQYAEIGNGSESVIAQAQGGDVTVGDTSTSAEKRYISAIKQVQEELLSNFNALALTINTIDHRQPAAFWDIRRANETELAYQDRAKNEFRAYQNEIGLYLDQLKFSTSVYASFQHDLAHDPKVAEQTRNVYTQQNEVLTSFNRLETGLDHLAALNLSDQERTAQGLSLHREMIVTAKMALTYAAAHFALITNTKDDMNLLSAALGDADIQVNLSPGRSGYQELLKLAAQFADEKSKILAERIPDKTQAAAREIERRINDPYLLLLRKMTGLPSTLTEAEMVALQRKEINLNEKSPAKLFELAAFSYLESDGHAAVLYFQRALASPELTPNLRKFAQLSIHRLEHPDMYGGSIGVMVGTISPGNGFAKSGLMTGDVIFSLDGEVVNDPMEIASGLAKNKGEPVLLGVIRDNKTQKIVVQSGEPAGAMLTQLIILQAIQL